MEPHAGPGRAAHRCRPDGGKQPRGGGERAAVVVTMVADPHALSAVTEGPDGVAAGIQNGVILIEMSTVGPQAISRLASALPSGS